MIVDGLDECSDGSETIHLIQNLNMLSQASNRRAMLLSKQNPIFKDHLNLAVSIRMDSEHVRPDVLLFVNREIDSRPELRDIKSEILNRIQHDTCCMFLWVSMMLKYLRMAPTRKLQVDRLKRFPLELADVYEEFLMDDAATLKDDDLIIRKQLFMILVAAQRILSIDEINSMLAMRTTPEATSASSLINPESKIRRLCWLLIDCDDNKVRLIHASVREFLVGVGTKNQSSSVRVRLDESNAYLAHVCLNQLCRYENMDQNIIVHFLR